MHDPLVVAWEVKLPIPRRSRWRERPDRPRWGVVVSRRTNAENLGQRTYRWWRPKGYTLHVAGRVYGWKDFVTVWHVEPGGHDSGEVCKWWRTNRKGERIHSRRWAWHVWHWRLQVHAWQRLKRFLFERCDLCSRGYKYGAATFGVGNGSYHMECADLVSMRRDSETKNAIIRHLFTVIDATNAEPAAELVKRLGMSFHEWYRLEAILGLRDRTGNVRETVPPRDADSHDERR